MKTVVQTQYPDGISSHASSSTLSSISNDDSVTAVDAMDAVSDSSSTDKKNLSSTGVTRPTRQTERVMDTLVALLIIAVIAGACGNPTWFQNKNGTILATSTTMTLDEPINVGSVREESWRAVSAKEAWSNENENAVASREPMAVATLDHDYRVRLIRTVLVEVGMAILFTQLSRVARWIPGLALDLSRWMRLVVSPAIVRGARTTAASRFLASSASKSSSALARIGQRVRQQAVRLRNPVTVVGANGNRMVRTTVTVVDAVRRQFQHTWKLGLKLYKTGVSKTINRSKRIIKSVLKKSKKYSTHGHDDHHKDDSSSSDKH